MYRDINCAIREYINLDIRKNGRYGIWEEEYIDEELLKDVIYLTLPAAGNTDWKHEQDIEEALCDALRTYFVTSCDGQYVSERRYVRISGYAPLKMESKELSSFYLKSLFCYNNNLVEDRNMFLWVMIFYPYLGKLFDYNIEHERWLKKIKKLYGCPVADVDIEKIHGSKWNNELLGKQRHFARKYGLVRNGNVEECNDAGLLLTKGIMKICERGHNYGM